MNSNSNESSQGRTQVIFQVDPGAVGPSFAPAAPIAGVERGAIIKVPDATPGIALVRGTQVPFGIPNVWRSAIAPAVNQVVDVQLDSGGQVASIAVVDAATIARERMQRGALAAQQGLGPLVAKMGKAPLVATSVLWLAFFFAPAIAIPLLGSLTSWDLVGVNLDSLVPTPGSRGLMSLLGLVALAAPLATPFVRFPKARLLFAAPAVFVVLFVLQAWWTIHSAIAKVEEETRALTGSMFGEYAGRAAKSAMGSALDMVSIGLGSYVVVGAAVALVVFALRPPAHTG